MLKDERFQSSLEPEHEEKWLPLQILNTVYATPGLPEDIQMDVMKVINMRLCFMCLLSSTEASRRLPLGFWNSPVLFLSRAVMVNLRALNSENFVLN